MAITKKHSPSSTASDIHDLDLPFTFTYARGLMYIWQIFLREWRGVAVRAPQPGVTQTRGDAIR